MSNNIHKAYVLGNFAGYVQECANKNEDFSHSFNNEKIVSSFQQMGTPELKWAFFRGFVDVSSVLSYDTPTCILICTNKKLKEVFDELHNDIPHKLSSRGHQTWTGTNAIDFLGNVFKGRQEENEKSSRYNIYLQWLKNSTKNMQSNLPRCEVFKTDDNAIVPSKSKESDVGYDLTVIKVAKKLSDKVTLYDTGIKISVDNGYYAEVVPRSSLSKSGYMLANSIGIIDRSYLGNILVALVKVDDSVPDIELPFRCCQLIFRPQIFVDVKEVDIPFEETTRGEGGFGSTGR
jgi:deoxyuridine 5'-triphosphate nucleotidohydrolase